MNRDDLLAHLILSTAGWLKTPAPEERSIAWEIHTRLQKIAKIDSRRRLSGTISAQDRSELCRAINDASELVVRAALDSLAVADSNNMEFVEVVEDDEGHKTTLRFNISSHVPLYLAQSILKVRLRLFKLKPSEQFQVMRTFQAWWPWSYAFTYTQFDRAEMSSEFIAKVIEDERLARATLENLKSKLSVKALDCFTSITNPAPAWEYAPSFVGIASAFKSDQLNEIGLAYIDIANEMSVPFKLSRSMPRPAQLACKNALATFQDCGTALMVLGTWIRALSITDHARVCKICYRHLGPKEVKFCTHHRHTADNRQTADAAYIAAEFEPHWRRFFSESRDLFEDFLKQTNSKSPPDARIVKAARGRVDEALVPAYVELASALNNLEELIAPTIDVWLRSHFERIVTFAQSSFDVQINGRLTVVEISEIRIQREFARRWLNIETFFATFYGAAKDDGGRESKFRARADLYCLHDIFHPIANGLPRSPGLLAQDITKLRCWIDAERKFLENAYLDVDEARHRMDQQTQSGKRVSMTFVAKELGASKQALSNRLKSKEAKTRERILKKYKASLMQDG